MKTDTNWGKMKKRRKKNYENWHKLGENEKKKK